NAAQLGELTLELLAGEAGPHRREVETLVDFLADLKPDAVVFSNALLSSTATPLRRRYDGPIWCVLQGDDIFLEALPETVRTKAIAAISTHAAAFTGFITHSRYYADFMAQYLTLRH